MTLAELFARRRRRAFATIAALGLIAVVGVTLAAVSTFLAGDVTRTRRAADDAQLRQLLIAGEAAVRASLAGAEPPAEVLLKLPNELASAGVELTIQRVDAEPAGVVSFRVTARDANGGAVHQTLRYARSAEGWRLRSADL